MTAPRLPEDRARQIRNALLAHSAWSRPPSRGRRRAWAGVAAIAVCALGVFLWLRQPHVTLEAAAAPPGPFERLALSMHDELGRTGHDTDFDSTSVPEVRDWVRSHGGLNLALVDRQGTPEAESYRVAGASMADQGPIAAAVVSYRIHEAPVTLVVAREALVDDSPRWTWLGKRIRTRVDPATGVRLLSWASSGQAYVLASALPGAGADACRICHADGRTLPTLQP